jgi:hypothetical protein
MTQWEVVVSLAVLVITYTSSIGAMVLWLANKFRQLEQLIYKEIHQLRREAQGARREYEQRLEGMGLRIQRIELRVFGFTKHPADEGPGISSGQIDDPPL